jgi:hypothetical protein
LQKRLARKRTSKYGGENNIMPYQNFSEAYIQPQYSSLNTVSQDKAANFSQELLIFLSQHPEFSTDKSQLDVLRYCYNHYINCDPITRDLPLQEKIKQAGEMAKNFMGIVLGKRG